MSLHRHASLATAFGPALLLAAALALPTPAVGAPSPDHGAKIEKHEQKQKKEKKDNRGQQRKREVQARQTTVQRQVTVQRQTTVQRQAVVQRQAAVRQQQIQIRRAAAAPPVYAQPRYRTAPGRPYAGENSPLFYVDGVLTDEGRRCPALRDHNGRFYTLVGKVEGLEIGDHVGVMVRRVLPQYAATCGQGDTVRVGQVRTLWSGSGHNRTVFDSRSDGDFAQFVQQDRYDRYRDDGYDDRYDRGGYDRDRDGYDRDRDGYDRDRGSDDGGGYRGSYDERDSRGGDRYGRVISVTGRLGGDDRCPTLRDRDGRLFGLSGDLRNYGPGETVRVIGFLGGQSRCGGTGIEVQEITRP